jgi:uncharacterized membrane protein YcaP (DUF421 family)
LDRVEPVALFSLAAAIGVPLQAPDRGLLPAVVIAVIVVATGRLIARMAFNSQEFESTAKDDMQTVVKDGIIQMKKMKQSRLTIERLFSQLRGESIRHLGEVKRLYFEENGSFSVVKYPKPKPGLAVIPLLDKPYLDEQKQAKENVCCTCGIIKDNEEECSNCGDTRIVSAIL